MRAEERQLLAESRRGRCGGRRQPQHHDLRQHFVGSTPRHTEQQQLVQIAAECGVSDVSIATSSAVSGAQPCTTAAHPSPHTTPR